MKAQQTKVVGTDFYRNTIIEEDNGKRYKRVFDNATKKVRKVRI